MKSKKFIAIMIAAVSVPLNSYAASESLNLWCGPNGNSKTYTYEIGGSIEYRTEDIEGSKVVVKYEDTDSDPSTPKVATKGHRCCNGDSAPPTDVSPPDFKCPKKDRAAMQISIHGTLIGG